MANTELSEFFSLVSQEKNQNKTRLKKQIENPQSDLANLFKELESALLETKKEPVVSVEDEPVVEPESIIEETSDEQTRLDEFSKLVTSFNSSTPSPVKKVEIIDTVDTASEEDKLESFSNLMDSLNKTKEEPEEVEAIIENEDEIKEASEVDYIKDTVTQIAATKPKNPRQVDVYEKPITNFKSLQKEFINFKQKVIEQLGSLGGGGSIRINDMEDLDTTGREDGDSLIYNSSTNKFTFSSNADSPNFSNQLSLEDSIDGNLLMNGTDSSSSDAGDDFLQESGVDGGRDLDHSVLQSLTTSIVPHATATFDLGSDTHRFRNLYLESDTVDIGGATISSDGSGVITISADGVTLPTGSKDADGFILARTISEASGATFKLVNLFTQASGMSTAATQFKFNARKSNTAVYTDAGHVFTLSNGTARSDSAVDLFQF